MGACQCFANADDITNKIESQIKVNTKNSQSVQKLLLLGSGSSGKSTIFKQLRDIYDIDTTSTEQPSEFDVIETLANMRQNCIQSTIKLLEKSEDFYNIGFKECRIDVCDTKYEKMVAALLKYRHSIWSVIRITDENESPSSSSSSEIISSADLLYLGECIHALWNLDQLSVHTYAKRNLYSIADNTYYFLNRSRMIFNNEYEPTFDDFLRVRIRSIGMKNIYYSYNNIKFHVFDVGGQRNERRKWLQYFDTVRAVIFVAALNAYFGAIFEDENKNAMHESIEVFEQIVNHSAFIESNFILLLNKNDLFEENIRKGISLKHCFSKDVKWKGEIWEGPDYDPNQDRFAIRDGHTSDDTNEDVNGIQITTYAAVDNKEAEQENIETPIIAVDNNAINGKVFAEKLLNMEQIITDDYFEDCYFSALEFIKSVYLSQYENSNKSIFVHLSTATNRAMVHKVFEDVQLMILKENMSRTGIAF